jgi:hypothetical protein
VMWNVCVTPAENGFAAILPVGRDWDGLGDGPVSADFSYVDTQLASMLAALQLQPRVLALFGPPEARRPVRRSESDL